MKKTLTKLSAIFMAMLILVSTMSVIATEEPADVDVELFVNGDCENFDDVTGLPTGSWCNNNTWGTTTKPEYNDVHGGTAALKVIGSKANTEYTQLYGFFVSTAPADTITEATGYIKILELAEGSYLKVGLYHTLLGDNYTLNANCTYKKTTDDWIQFVCPTMTDRTNTNIYIEFRLYGTGSFLVDDMSVVQTTSSLIPGKMEHDLPFIYGVGTTQGVHFGVTDAEAFEGDKSLFVGGVASARAYYVFNNTRNKLKTGEKYKISMWCKSSDANFYPCVMIGKHGGGQNPYSARYASLWHPDNTNPWTIVDEERGWKKYEACITMPEVDAGKEMGFLIARFDGTTMAYYDNIEITKDVDGPVTLKKNYTEVTTASAGESIKASAHIVSNTPAADGGRAVNVIVAAYKEVNGTKTLVDVKIKNETVASDIQRKTASGELKFTRSSMDVTMDYTVPAEATEIKAFAWEAGTIMPIGGSKTVSVVPAA